MFRATNYNYMTDPMQLPSTFSHLAKFCPSWDTNSCVMSSWWEIKRYTKELASRLRLFDLGELLWLLISMAGSTVQDYMNTWIREVQYTIQKYPCFLGKYVNLTKCALRVFPHPMLQSPILGPLFTQYLCLYFIHATYCASWPYGLCSGVVREFFRDYSKRFCICTYKIRRDRELVLEWASNYQYLAVCVCLNNEWKLRDEMGGMGTRERDAKNGNNGSPSTL